MCCSVLTPSHGRSYLQSKSRVAASISILSVRAYSITSCSRSAAAVRTHRIARYDAEASAFACGVNTGVIVVFRENSCEFTNACHLAALMRPRCAACSLPQTRGRGECRALAAPMARLRKKVQAAGTTSSAETSRHSPRDGFPAYTFSPRGPAFLPPSLATLVKSIASLVSAPGDQDHTISPSASRHSSVAAFRVHRSPLLRIVTTRTSLAMRRDMHR